MTPFPAHRAKRTAYPSKKSLCTYLTRYMYTLYSVCHWREINRINVMVCRFKLSTLCAKTSCQISNSFDRSFSLRAVCAAAVCVCLSDCHNFTSQYCVESYHNKASLYPRDFLDDDVISKLMQSERILI